MKYLWEIHSVYLKIEDLPLDYCAKVLKEFHDASNVDKPSQIEITCRKAIEELIAYINSLKSFTNTKLEKLAELVNANHEKNSRGLISSKMFS